MDVGGALTDEHGGDWLASQLTELIEARYNVRQSPRSLQNWGEGAFQDCVAGHLENIVPAGWRVECEKASDFNTCWADMVVTGPDVLILFELKYVPWNYIFPEPEADMVGKRPWLRQCYDLVEEAVDPLSIPIKTHKEKKREPILVEYVQPEITNKLLKTQACFKPTHTIFLVCVGHRVVAAPTDAKSFVECPSG